MGEKYIDQNWKDIITDNADDAILFFKPDLAKDRDFGRNIQLAANELPEIDSGTDKGMRISDICMSVPVKGGTFTRIAFHIEQQHEPDGDFALRMFQSYYRVSDRLKIPVTSLAIFTGDIETVDSFRASCYGTEINFRYNIYEVAKADDEALKRDDRVFALVALAAKRMLDARGDPRKRGEYSMELLELARRRDFETKKIRGVLKFIYGILRLGSDDIDQKTREVWKMKLIPIEEAVREIHIRQAKEEGFEKGVNNIARSMRADGLPVEMIVKYTGLNEKDILAMP
jgi:hypothetical protein